jgi:hypothetical protein
MCGRATIMATTTWMGATTNNGNGITYQYAFISWAMDANVYK